MKSHYLGIDIGIGQGAKIGLFADGQTLVDESLVAVDEYGATFERFALAIETAIDRLLAENELSIQAIRSIGVACAGILRSDGTFQLVVNYKHLNGHNLKTRLEKTFGIPLGIENDANASALAEWSMLRLELIYWVFGGGWGGAWVDAKGTIRFSAVDWDGNDDSLHFTNEPGYAIPLEKDVLKKLFREVGASYERFQEIITEEYSPSGGVVIGPGGDANTLRAEVVLSGPGRLRLFRALAGDAGSYEHFLDGSEIAYIKDPARAGKYIDKLSGLMVEAAVNTDRLYGKILAEATQTMLRQAYDDGMPKGLPICLGGKPSYALPYFGPSAQRALARLGILNYLRPSMIDERGGNANLIGSAVLAEQVFEASG